MQVIHARCCGLDVHQKTVVACLLLSQEDGTVQRSVRTFSTMTAGLLALADWLRSQGVTHVALESTGVYWWPVFNILEAEVQEVVLVNPQHMKAVPGRKTDVKDSEWLADLLRHGLVRASFIPPAPIRALRELTRYRATLVQARTAETNRLHKVLEAANLKLAAVASTVLGVSGRAMLNALVTGEDDPMILAELARGRLRAQLPALRQALHGRLQPQHRVLITQILAHIDFIDTSIARLHEEIDQHLAPLAEAVALVQTIPCISALSATVIVAEIGVDMTRFPSAKHLASWAGLCPGNRQSGGRRLSGRITSGNPWLRAVLGEAAWGIARSKGTYLHAHYERIARRRGRYRAAVAVAHSLLVIVYHVLRERTPYRDLGADYFDTLDAERLQRHHVRRLEQLGYHVELTPHSAA